MTKPKPAGSEGQVVLSIGYMDFLLPNSSGVEAILKVLARAESCRDHLHQGELIVDENTFELGMKLVPARTKIIRPSDAPRLVHKEIVNAAEMFP